MAAPHKLIVHHLNDSRSQRILWLLEELGLEYEIISYARDKVTRLAPASLKAIHPLGKSPVIEDKGRVIAESGCIVEYLIRTYQHPEKPLMPKEDSPLFYDYLYWLHFSEGSAMLPLILGLYVGLLGENGAPLKPRITSEIANHLGFMNQSLGNKEFFVGDSLTGADFQLVFVCEAAAAKGLLADYPNLRAYTSRIQSRPAYLKGLERGGPYSYAKH